MVDLSYLEKFTKGNSLKMRRYISMYLTTAPDAFERMDKNIKENSWSELAINAHSLKPQAEFMGLYSLKERLSEIENNVKSDQLKDIVTLFEEAKKIHDESEVFLKKYIENT